MKSLTLFLILFIIKSSVSKPYLNKYSINQFLDEMRRDGNFTIILSIKAEFGDDVAIISCEEIKINHCGNCKNAVKNYMSIPKPHPRPPKPGDGSISSASIDNKVTLQKILNNNFNKIKAKSLYDKIIKKCKINNIKI